MYKLNKIIDHKLFNDPNASAPLFYWHKCISAIRVNTLLMSIYDWLLIDDPQISNKSRYSCKGEMSTWNI